MLRQPRFHLEVIQREYKGIFWLFFQIEQNMLNFNSQKGRIQLFIV